MSEIVVIIRPSFMKFCQDGCRAALFNHILYWIAKKSKDQPQDKIQAGEITYYDTTEVLTKKMANAWGSEKVRLEVNKLVDMGLIGRGKNPEWGADRTKHFYFGKEQCEKLFELCQGHEICLACLGMDKDIVHLIKTVKQICNPRNANHESVICSKHKHFWNSGFANHESVGAITEITTEITETQITERKNDATEQNSTVSTQDDSFSHSSTQSSSLDLLPEVRRTYDLICQELYPNCHPNLTTKGIEHFTKLSSSIKTVEDIKSLVAYCRQEQPVLNTSKIHPGNLVRWLDGWLQAKPPVTEPLPELPSDPVVTDEELEDDVWKFVQAYQDEEHFEECLERVKAMRREAELSNYKMSDKMANACRRAPSSRCGIEDFFEQLRQDLYW
ncbi:MAG TPA: hypothetical protein VHV10_03995 [Ktedonobacteraceae bacterium]|nr:hypothetical protein [Ktedonobacteraceae bacterium]